MKKVNFNALQNFEVPESWIENAINAKPKKKPFYLNPRYYGTAAALVIAVGIAAFSLLYLNRDFTPPTGQNVEGTSVSSTLSGQRLTEIPGDGEIKTTEIQNVTKPTEKPKATELSEPVEGNEESNEQSIASENQESENTDLEGRTPAQSESSEQNEQSGRNEQENNTKKQESNIQPQKSTAPIEQQQNTERVIDNTVSTDVADPTTSIKTINTGWEIKIPKYSTEAAATYSSITGNKEEQILCGDLFTKTIEIIIPNNIRNNEDIDVNCIIKGADKYTKNVEGTLYLSFQQSINTFFDNGMISVNLSNDFDDFKINIPCGKYKIELKCTDSSENTIYDNSIEVTLNNDSESINLDYD